MRLNIEKYKNKSRSDLHSSRLSYSIIAWLTWQYVNLPTSTECVTSVFVENEKLAGQRQVRTSDWTLTGLQSRTASDTVTA